MVVGNLFLGVPFIVGAFSSQANSFQGLSMNAMASQQNKGGFAALDGTGMAPLQPMNNNSVMQPMQPTSSHAPVFSSTAQNTMFGAKPMSNQHFNQQAFRNKLFF